MKLPALSSPLNKSFFSSNTLKVAKELIGKGLLVFQNRKPLLVEITEVEAYLGTKDPASHSYNGLTKRNWPMFEEAGMCYVYLSYGINFCMNVVTEAKGKGEAVLIRAGRPVLGIEQMFKNRGLRFETSENVVKSLCNGPGKLTKALGIDLNFNGISFIDSNRLKIVELKEEVSVGRIVTTPRIGISKAMDLPYRYIRSKSIFLSRPYKEA